MMKKVTCLFIFLLNSSIAWSGERFESFSILESNHKGLTDHYNKFVWFHLKKSWEQPSSDKYNYRDAKKSCASLGGRLPSEKELKSVLDTKLSKPLPNFEQFIEHHFWTSTIHKEKYPMWVAFTGSGMAMFDDPNTEQNVICVSQQK